MPACWRKCALLSLCVGCWPKGGLDPQRYKSVRLHRVDGGALLARFGSTSKARADLAFVRQLFMLGRAEGQRWLQAHAADARAPHHQPADAD